MLQYLALNTHFQLSARNLPPTLKSLAQLPPFLHTGVRLAEVHKTGLGSSAALITSLVSALLLRLGVIPADAFDSPTPSEGRRLAHNVAQYVHCLAQGKVGSGFDVSSAVFGSQLYTRFDPLVLQPLMDDNLVRFRRLVLFVMRGCVLIRDCDCGRRPCSPCRWCSRRQIRNGTTVSSRSSCRRPLGSCWRTSMQEATRHR